MKRWCLIVLVCLSGTGMVQAGVAYRDSCYSIGLTGAYAYNETYDHHGSFALSAFMPVYKYFEGNMHIRFQTANVYDISVRLRPKFLLPVGELYFETQVLYNLIRRNDLHGLCGALSLGYRMDYVQVHIGYGTRSFWPLDISSHTSETSVHEPHNLIYYLEVFVRPCTSMWNLSVCVTDITEYQMERMYTPIFMVNSYMNIGSHWRITARGLCKPVGLSNYTPSFYGAEIAIGGHYRF